MVVGAGWVVVDVEVTVVWVPVTTAVVLCCNALSPSLPLPPTFLPALSPLPSLPPSHSPFPPFFPFSLPSSLLPLYSPSRYLLPSLSGGQDSLQEEPWSTDQTVLESRAGEAAQLPQSEGGRGRGQTGRRVSRSICLYADLENAAALCCIAMLDMIRVEIQFIYGHY